MKQFFFLIPLLTTSIHCFSQKQYNFDYLIEYELTFYDYLNSKHKDSTKKGETQRRYYLTNSKNNSYFALITNLDSLNYNMYFRDNNNLTFNVNFFKTDLNYAEFLNVDCKYINHYALLLKGKTKEYDFVNLTDTVINGKPYMRYKLTSIKPKRTKRKKLSTAFYIIDKQTQFHLPLLHHPTAYQEWNNKKNIPNGIFKEQYFIDFYGNITLKEKMIAYYKIDKKIIIDENCDYNKTFYSKL